jgi:CheY-like chemotaxis protein
MDGGLEILMTEEERERVARLVRTNQIGPMPDGPMIEHFDPSLLAEAIEQQAARALLLFDVPKVDLHMDAADALRLARWLRQAPGPRA